MPHPSPLRSTRTRMRMLPTLALLSLLVCNGTEAAGTGWSSHRAPASLRPALARFPGSEGTSTTGRATRRSWPQGLSGQSSTGAAALSTTKGALSQSKVLATRCQSSRHPQCQPRGPCSHRLAHVPRQHMHPCSRRSHRLLGTTATSLRRCQPSPRVCREYPSGSRHAVRSSLARFRSCRPPAAQPSVKGYKSATEAGGAASTVASTVAKTIVNRIEQSCGPDDALDLCLFVSMRYSTTVISVGPQPENQGCHEHRRTDAALW